MSWRRHHGREVKRTRSVDHGSVCFSVEAHPFQHRPRSRQIASSKSSCRGSTFERLRSADLAAFAARTSLSSPSPIMRPSTTAVPGIRNGGSAWARWREQLYAFMHHNAQRPGAYFKIPSAQVMEIGIEFEM